MLLWIMAETALAVRAWRVATQSAVELLDAHLAEITDRADARAQEAVALADARLQEAMQRLDARLSDAIARSDARLSDAIERSDVLLSDATSRVDARLADATARLDARVGEAIDRADRRVAEAASRLDYWTDCEQNGLCWQGMVTDVLTASRRAALTIDRAVPEMVAASQATARSMDATAAASAATARNLAEITRPGPRWLRYLGMGLSVAAPASQVAVPFVLRRAEIR
jgi:hypothetical protein